MKTNIGVRLLVLCGLLFVGGSLQPRNLESQNEQRPRNLPAKEVYTGSAVAVGGQFGGASRPFTLEITGLHTGGGGAARLPSSSHADTGRLYEGYPK